MPGRKQQACATLHAMLDIRLIREQPDFVKSRLATRGGDDQFKVEEVLAVDSVLSRLAALDERAARVVEYRIFVGLTLEETAAAMDTSVRTIQRSWTTARAWLRKEMRGSRDHEWRSQ